MLYRLFHSDDPNIFNTNSPKNLHFNVLNDFDKMIQNQYQKGCIHAVKSYREWITTILILRI